MSSTYSTFCQTPNNQMAEPMFFGQNVNVARYDQQKHPIFEKLIENHAINVLPKAFISAF